MIPKSIIFYRLVGENKRNDSGNFVRLVRERDLKDHVVPEIANCVKKQCRNTDVSITITWDNGNRSLTIKRWDA